MSLEAMKTELVERALRLAQEGLGHPLSSRPAGLFVMLREGEELRGGMGTTEASGPLETLLPELVVEAAFRDPRHPPIDRATLDRLNLELWLLPEAPRRVREAAEVDPAHDVLRIRQGIHAATFLPDIAVARGWDAAASLAYACRKAGLHAAEWRKPETEVLAFRSLLAIEP